MSKTNFQPHVFRALRGVTGEISAYIYEIPLRVKFRGLTRRAGVLLKGPAAWAEFSPFAEYDTQYSARWLLGALDTALFGYPSARRNEIAVNATIPAVPAPQAAKIAAQFAAGTAKVKVVEKGQDVAADLSRLAAVREVLGAEAKIRIDVNGRWDLATALQLLPQYDRAAGGLEYAEQPCSEVEDLARLRRQLPQIKIAADESIRRAADPLAVVRQEAADVIVLKNQPLGGVRAALELSAQMGLPVVVSSALESSLGLVAGVQLARALPDLPYAAGLGTAKLFGADVSSHPLLPCAGKITARATEQVQPDLLLCAYQQAAEGLLADMALASAEIERTPLPSRNTWNFWRQRLMQVWDYCSAAGWLHHDFQLKIVQLPSDSELERKFPREGAV